MSAGSLRSRFRYGERIGGKVRRHVPDLLLCHDDGGVTVVDVKPAHRLADPVVCRVFDWTAEIVGLRGWRFETWSGADPVMLANVRFLAGYRRPLVIDTSLEAPILEMIDRQASIGGVERAASSIAAPERVRPVLLHLLWSGVLATDLSLPLGAGSPVWPTEER